MSYSLSNADQQRISHTKTRLNILDNCWEYEVQDRMREQYSLQNVNMLGRPSTSINLFANVVGQLAIHYDTPSIISNPELNEVTSDIWAATINNAHLWSVLQENDRKLIGLRENFVFVHVTDDGIQLEAVPPCEVVIDKTGGDKSKPAALRRFRSYLLMGEKGLENVPCWECWDISDSENPCYWIETSSGDNITSSVDPAYSEYKWIDSSGPFIPCVFYRAKTTSQTWDSYAWSEIVSGTLDIAIHWTMWGLCQRNASYPQWYAIDLSVPGTAINPGQGQKADITPRNIDIMPSTLLMLHSKEGHNGTIGQLEAVDLLEMSKAILLRQNTILSNIGIHPDDVTSSAPESGVAISLKRSAQRKAALSYIPNLRVGDEQLCSIIAKIYNIFYAPVNSNIELPVYGWSIDYCLPESSTDEFLADLEKDKGLIALGLKSTVEVCRKLYGLDSDEAAIEKLTLIREQNKLFPLIS